MLGFIHITGGQSSTGLLSPRSFRTTQHITMMQLCQSALKPLAWMANLESRKWKNTLVITNIEDFSIETISIRRCDGSAVKQARRDTFVLSHQVAEDAAASSFPSSSTIPESISK